MRFRVTKGMHVQAKVSDDGKEDLKINEYFRASDPEHNIVETKTDLFAKFGPKFERLPDEPQRATVATVAKK